MTGEQLGWVLATGVLLACYVGTWFAALARAQAVDVTAVLVLAAPITAGLSAAVERDVPGAAGRVARAASSSAARVAVWLGGRGAPVGARPAAVETSG